MSLHFLECYKNEIIQHVLLFFWLLSHGYFKIHLCCCTHQQFIPFYCCDRINTFSNWEKKSWPCRRPLEKGPQVPQSSRLFCVEARICRATAYLGLYSEKGFIHLYPCPSLGPTIPYQYFCKKHQRQS